VLRYCVFASTIRLYRKQVGWMAALVRGRDLRGVLRAEAWQVVELEAPRRPRARERRREPEEEELPHEPAQRAPQHRAVSRSERSERREAGFRKKRADPSKPPARFSQFRVDRLARSSKPRTPLGTAGKWGGLAPSLATIAI